MSVELQQIIDNIHDRHYPQGSWSDTSHLFPGLDARSRNCIRNAGIDTHAKGKLLMTKAPHEVLNLPNAGESTLASLIDYFVNDNTSSWAPESNRTAYIHRGIKSFRAADISEDEWQYITNKWFKSDKATLKSQSKQYVAELRRIHNGESLVQIARETSRCSSTIQHQVNKSIRILNSYIMHLPTFKTAQLLES